MLLCHTTIVLSDKEYVQASYFPGIKDKIKLIPPGITAPTFVSVDGSKQAISRLIGMELSDYNKKTVIGTIAELHPNKALPNLIDAMATVVEQEPNAVCIILGDGQDKDSLRALVEKKSLEHNVFIPGFLDNASEYLKAFNIFALSSIKEGLPYVILEAGCASLPVVATTVGGVPEVVEDMKSGILVQPRSPRELSHALSFMIEHPDERKKYGSSLKERVSLKYSMEKMLWLVEGLYSNSIADR